MENIERQQGGGLELARKYKVVVQYTYKATEGCDK